jgi:hypothetical protein
MMNGLLLGGFGAAAQVGLDHLLDRPARGPAALGDLLAEVEHRDGVADAHHHVHVVLDEDHGDAVVADLADDGHQLLDVGRGQAGGRLVEQQQLRVERQRARDLQQALLAVGQVARLFGRQLSRPTNFSRPSARCTAAALSRR